MAEKEGFEPSIPFWGIHDFQSCALGQLRDFSMRSALADLHILLQPACFVNPYFRIISRQLQNVPLIKSAAHFLNGQTDFHTI